MSCYRYIHKSTEISYMKETLHNFPKINFPPPTTYLFNTFLNGLIIVNIGYIVAFEQQENFQRRKVPKKQGLKSLQFLVGIVLQLYSH